MALTPEQKRLRHREYERRYKAKHPGRKAALERDRRAKKKTPETMRRAADYVRELERRWREAEAGRPKPERCEACDRERPLQFDHCHQRNIFRGWICGNCNAALGHVRDSPDHLRKLIAYLERTATLTGRQMSLPLAGV